MCKPPYSVPKRHGLIWNGLVLKIPNLLVSIVLKSRFLNESYYCNDMICLMNLTMLGLNIFPARKRSNNKLRIKLFLIQTHKYLNKGNHQNVKRILAVKKAVMKHKLHISSSKPQFIKFTRVISSLL